MDDLSVAHLVLLTASKADGGCLPCVQGCVDEALHEHPELPWEEAAQQLQPVSTATTMAEAVRSSRRLLDGGFFPRVSPHADRKRAN